MPHPLFKNPDERTIAVTAGAAVAVHGLLASGYYQTSSPAVSKAELAREAFDLAEAFIAEAERRFGP